MPTVASIATTCSFVWKIHIVASKVSHKDSKILFNLFFGIPFLEKYERTYGPINLFPIIIFTPLLDDRINSHMASRRNGVVGSIGRNIPNVPIDTQNKAAPMYRYFLIFSYIRKDNLILRLWRVFHFFLLI